MKFIDLVLKRQSQRKYSSVKVEREKIEQCIEAARLAPSACNAQPWKFIIVDDEDKKNQIADYAASIGMNKFVFQASAIVVVVLEKPNFTSKIGSVLKGKEFMLMDIGIAAEHFCLQAAELELGTCMVGWFNEKKVKKTLKVPRSKRLPLLITIGYPEGELREKIRKTQQVIMSENKY